MQVNFVKPNLEEISKFWGFCISLSRTADGWCCNSILLSIWMPTAGSLSYDPFAPFLTLPRVKHLTFNNLHFMLQEFA